MAGSGSPAATAAALAAMQSAIAAKGAPYAPTTASLGSPPSINPDIAICSVFLVLFLCCAGLNLKIFKDNKCQGINFGFNMAQTMFCVFRIVAICLRMAWSFHQTNVSLALAAEIFLYAGVVILFAVNLFFTERLMRARHPTIGWSKLFTIISWPIPLIIIVIVVIMIITVAIDSFFTLDEHTLYIDHMFIKSIVTVYLIIACLPFLWIAVMFIIPARAPLDSFGTGSFKAKVLLVLTSTALLVTGAGFRCGTDWMPEASIFEHPWYYSKACFYIFNFSVEICSLVLYLAARVDKRFYVPAGAKGPGAYSASFAKDSTREALPESFYLPTLDLDTKESGRTNSKDVESDGHARSMSDNSSKSDMF